MAAAKGGMAAGRRRRGVIGAGVVAAHVAVVLVLAAWQIRGVPPADVAAMRVVNVRVEPPVPPVEPVVVRAAPKAAGVEGQRAAPVVVSPAPPVPAPAEVAAAVDAGDALATGTGTEGSGPGAGGTGDGTGGGGVGSRWVRGAIGDRDWPRGARTRRAEGVVDAYFTVRPDGGVEACRVVRSSGDAELDAVTCRLIEERFRYAPAVDGAGRAVADTQGWRQQWWLEKR